MRRLEVLDTGAVPDGGILRSTDFTTMSKSDDIIRNTQSWAAARRAEIEQKLEEERKEVLAAAYREGLSAFVEARDGYAQATDALAQKLEFLLHKSLHRVLGVWPPKEILQATLAPLLSDLERQGDVRLLVHPNQVVALRAFLDGHVRDLGAFAVVADPSLDEPDCVIFTQSEIVTLTIPVLVDQLMTAMSQYVALAVAVQREEFGDSAAPARS
jgi:flagellar biosynthesis/type III secretory pathway protein FliH